MVRKKSKKLWLVWLLVAVVGLFLLVLLLRGVGRISLESHGHGSLSVSSGESLLMSLGIRDDFDYVDKFTGESFCFDDACWDVADANYDVCVSRVEGDDYTLCEEEYDAYLRSECSVRCESEIYVWDGSPVTDLGEFSSYAFPDFTSNSKIFCEAWFIGGTWISVPEKVGCEGASFVFCDGASVSSAGEVCGEIGKVWVCDWSSAYCMNS